MSESGVAPSGARLHVGRVSITLEPTQAVETGSVAVSRDQMGQRSTG